MRVPANLSSVLVALLGVTLVYACGGGEKKKSGGGSSAAAPAPAPIPLPSPSPSPSPSNPCLTGNSKNLVDEGETDHDHEGGMDHDHEGPSPGPAPAPAPSTEDGGGATNDCGPGTSPGGQNPGSSPGTGPGTGPSTGPSPSPGTGGGGGMTDIGKGVDGCAAEGKVWTPGKPAASCGPQVWDAICCNAEAWLAAFAQHSKVADAKAAIDKNVADGKKLYGCSVDGAKWTLHFAKLFESVGYSYSTYYLTFSGGKQPVTGMKPASCPALPTMAELGYKAPATGPSPGPAPGPSPGPANPDPAATFTATTPKADILTWLKTGAYTTSTGDNAWKANTLHDAGATINAGSIHQGKVRVYYNKTATAAFAANANLTQWPLNSVIVKELKTSANVLKGFAFMAKIKAGTGEDSWLWYEIVDKESTAATGNEFYGVGGTAGVTACTGCHDDGKDYVRELPQ